MFDDPYFQHREYRPMLGCAQSKTANILFALSVDDRDAQHGVRPFCLHPGSIVSTDLGRNSSRKQLLDFDVIDTEGRPVLDPQRQLKTREHRRPRRSGAESPSRAGFVGVYC
jgi:NAD(P)-dependent dehydrogenase (short-subunit alcohol dehydrogenase family)